MDCEIGQKGKSQAVKLIQPNTFPPLLFAPPLGAAGVFEVVRFNYCHRTKAAQHHLA
jgi:hypothetical protein